MRSFIFGLSGVIAIGAVIQLSIVSEPKAQDLLEMQIEEIPAQDEIEVLRDDIIDLESLAASNPVTTTCRLTDQGGDGWYRRVNVYAKNNTNRNRTCTFKCVVGQKSGRDRVVQCRATIKGNQTARVCGYYSSNSRMKKVKSVSDTNPC